MSGFVGARVPRLEDERFLAGRGRYVDDIVLPNMRFAAILRSPFAHGTIRSLAPPGPSSTVELFLGPADVQARVAADVPVVWSFPGQQQLGHPLVDDRVRYVGQPIGVAVGSSRAEAEDGLEDALIEIDELPAVGGLDAALGPGAPLLYPEWGTNVAVEVESGDGEDETAAVFSSAEHVLRARLRTGRLTGAPMETRGVLADPSGGRLTMWTSTQAPHMVRDMVCRVLGLPHARVRVIGPDVGGGFGLKDHVYEDELLVCLAALELGRPVKWIEDRSESLTVTTQARDEVFDVEVAFDGDGTLRGLRCNGIRDVGAVLSVFGAGPLRTMGDNLPGPYRWEAVRMTGQAIVTNRAPTGAYRGFGQPQATVVRERVVDLVAGELGADPVELRLRNMIRSDELPYRTRTFLRFESGDYPEALTRARDLIRAAQPSPDDGLARGVGFSFYVELCGIGPRAGARVLGIDASTYEMATVQMEVDGSVRITAGTSPHGQGHETTYAQLCAERLGVPLSSISLIHSDTDITPYSSYGTAASRSIAVAGGAVVEASERLAARIRRVAAELMEVEADDVTLAEGSAKVAGTELAIPLSEVAAAAIRGHRLPDGMEPGLSETYLHEPDDLSFSYAAHACAVAIDRETGRIDVERFVVVHDCGTMVNPTIVEGQIHGGVAQGIGAAILEGSVFDERAQPLATTFADYLLPASTSLPAIEIEHTVHPSPFIPGGMKGMGEGGTIGATAAVMNAVAAALPEIAEQIDQLPLTPARIRAWMRPGRPGDPPTRTSDPATAAATPEGPAPEGRSPPGA
jgi:carbon-monoxide dehydrogenase large subunit